MEIRKEMENNGKKKRNSTVENERQMPANSQKERILSVPQLLLKSASMATAWLTTGTVYFQKTMICGYLNLELDPQQRGEKKPKWNLYEKIQDKLQNDVQRRCRAYKSKV